MDKFFLIRLAGAFALIVVAVCVGNQYELPLAVALYEIGRFVLAAVALFALVGCAMLLQGVLNRKKVS
jgi:hypothetical protein